MFDIFKKNLHKASMLAYIFVVNLPSPEEEIKFIMGNQDLSKEDFLRKICNKLTNRPVEFSGQTNCWSGPQVSGLSVL